LVFVSRGAPKPATGKTGKGVTTHIASFLEPEKGSAKGSIPIMTAAAISPAWLGRFGGSFLM
jgi:hypothetical protein